MTAERVEQLVDLGRHDEALALLGPLVAADPADPHLHEVAARALLGAGRPQQALDAATEVVRLAPDREIGPRLRSIAFTDLGHGDAAVHAAQEAVRLAPVVWLTHLQLAIALTTRSRHDPSALLAADRAVALAPHEADAHYVRGVVAGHLDDRTGARAAYRRALALDPQHSAALNNLGAMESTRLARQLRLFTAALRADPQDPTARQNLLVVLRNLLVVVTGMALVAADLGAATCLDAGRGGTPFAVGVGVVLVVAVTVLVGGVLRAASRGVVHHVRSQARDDGVVMLFAVLAVTMTGLALVLCWTSGLADRVVHTTGVGHLLVGGTLTALVALFRSGRQD